MPSVWFHTLGCKLNFAETSTIARAFDAAGYSRASSAREADICLVNSCAVTAEAEKKCRALVRRIRRENPAAKLVFTGCYATLHPDAIDGAEVFSNFDKIKIAQAGDRRPETGTLLEHIFSASVSGLRSPASDFFPAYSTGERTRAFLKVQDGCDYRCSYCTVPLARGASRNLPIADAVGQARAIAATGIREIVLTGINTGDFGRTTGESFLDLLHALEGVDGIERYRISSIEPNLLTDEIIAFCAASAKFMPHFHIPLQSGSDRILGLMQRRYTAAKFAERIEAVRARMPDAFLGIDVIVGFPGETQADFQQTYDLLERLQISFLHVFPYSERPNTPAIELPEKVAPAIAAQRVKTLMALSDRLHAAFAAKFAGQPAKVLWESTLRGGKMAGFTENYIRVEAPYDKTKINTISPHRFGREATGSPQPSAAKDCNRDCTPSLAAT